MTTAAATSTDSPGPELDISEEFTQLNSKSPAFLSHPLHSKAELEKLKFLTSQDPSETLVLAIDFGIQTAEIALNAAKQMSEIQWKDRNQIIQFFANSANTSIKEAKIYLQHLEERKFEERSIKELQQRITKVEDDHYKFCTKINKILDMDIKTVEADDNAAAK